MKIRSEEKTEQPKLVEGVDFYFENGLMVLTAHFLKNRGYCCGNSCRHCPYPDNPDRNATVREGAGQGSQG